MNKITQSLAITPERRTALAVANEVNAVRKPDNSDCLKCNGEGELSGYFTNDPGERLRHWECPRCDGTGQEPETEEEE